jgi:signal transduction histidine kinase
LLNSLSLNYQTFVESERQKLSRELHDELGSILTATKMDLSWVIKKVKDSAPDIAEKLKKTNTYLDQGINFKRQIVESLHPSLMNTLGLWPALKSIIEDAAGRSQWELTLNLPEDTSTVDETISLIAYRVVQESLNNASKYAQATKVSVDINTDGNYLKLEIEDNGKGFDVSSLHGDTHGLAGMRHRVLAIGGKFEITSAINQGTTTWVMIPLKAS